MASVTTTKFKSDSIGLLKDDIENNNYFLFVSSQDRTTAVNSVFSTRDFLEKTLFGKQIESEENFFYMIKNYPWQVGLVYDQYDDLEDLSDKKYYAVVYPGNNDTGDFRIFKCLFNNGGSPAQFPPNFDESTPDQIYRTGDGYVWKYMYSLSETDFDRYVTRGYIPITANNLVSNTDLNTSSVDTIFVENKSDNIGYEKVEGNVVIVNSVPEGIVQVFDTIVIEAGEGYALSEVENYYAGQSFYGVNINTNLGSVYTIETYTYNAEEKRGIITLTDNPQLDGNISANLSTFQILPRILITGDGEGALAVPDVVNGRIDDIILLNSGSGYTNVSASVIDPLGFDPLSENEIDVRATLRPILSPPGGHASNLIEELSCRHSMVYAQISQSDNQFFAPSNQFCKIGLVKNPEFTSNTTIFDNRIQVEVSNTSVIEVDSEIIQLDIDNQTTFSGRVHEIENDTVYISQYIGPYANQANTNFSLNPDSPFVTPGGELIEINTTGGGDPIITYPPYIPKTGEVYYMNDFLPQERNQDSRELFKIIIEF